MDGSLSGVKDMTNKGTTTTTNKTLVWFDELILFAQDLACASYS
jgi:hypothetical protein